MYKKLIIILILLLVSTGLQAEDFVEMISPAESIGLGDCFVANSIGPNSCFLNPAGLSHSFVNQYSVGGGMWVGEVNLFMGSAVVPTEIGNFGAGVGWLGMGADEYENAVGEYTGQALNFDNLLINLGYARELLNIPIGVNLKFIKSSMAMDKKLLILSDIGIMYSFGPINTGLMLRNFGISSYDPGDWGEVRTGACWEALSLKSIEVKVLSDIYFAYEEDMGINVGTEVGLFNIALVRAGFSTKGYNKIQMGAGFKFNVGQFRVKLDYGINPALEGLDMSHFIQITFNSRTKELTKKTESLLTKADDYIDSGDYNAAEREIEKALKVSPDDKELKKKILHIQNKKKEKEAVFCMDKAEEYLKTKDYKKARLVLERAVKLLPKNKKGHCELGKVYYEQGSYRKALECFRKALAIDKDYEEAKKMEGLIAEKVEEQKPIWLKEDKYYAKKTLVFDDFQEETIMAKLITDHGEITSEKDGDLSYGKWEVKKGTNEKVLHTAIRLPNLSKFKGMMVSLKSDDIKVIKIVLVEQLATVENHWQVPLAGIINEWKNIQIPFHYLQLPGKPGSTIDLGRITQIRFVVDKDKSGEMCIDNIEFYQ